eukprot:CAMPEP_0194388004 /NCGR_PEP_ID=MMETSP0174-20130528/95819_1 /TAXON_ID=216777 /ORGANISM="Proboscia alata, Strain PI-D3" /LENGTH=144 /DNA_ID=CAMNT_0039178805 /DNA_START=51 /DNA_END=482 /DNA_ORIENTATION=-
MGASWTNRYKQNNATVPMNNPDIYDICRRCNDRSCMTQWCKRAFVYYFSFRDDITKRFYQTDPGFTTSGMMLNLTPLQHDFFRTITSGLSKEERLQGVPIRSLPMKDMLQTAEELEENHLLALLNFLYMDAESTDEYPTMELYP